MSRKQWQVTINIAPRQEQSVTLYDETLVALREQVYTWLCSNHPTYMRAGMSIFKKEGKTWSPWMTSVDEQAYRYFINQGPGFREGPEYEEQGIINGVLELSSVRKTIKHDAPDEVNKLLQRGWRLIAFQNKFSSEEGTYYVLGHTEHDAF